MFSALVRPSEVPVRVTLAATIRTTDEIRNSNLALGVPPQVTVSAQFGIRVRVARPDGQPRLVVDFRFIDFIMASFTSINAQVEMDRTIELPLGAVEAALGGMQIVGANLKSFGGADILPDQQLVILRLLLQPLPRFLPVGAEFSDFIAELQSDYVNTENIAYRPMREVLGDDAMAFSALPNAFASIVQATVETGLTASGRSRLETNQVRNFLLYSGVAPNELVFRAGFDVRIDGGCRSPWAPGDRTDLVVGLQPVLSLTAERGMLVMRGQAQYDVHFAWAILCVGNILASMLRFGPVGGPAAVSISLVLLPILVPLLYMYLGSSGSARQIAAQSGGAFAFDAERNELVARVPLPVITIPNPFVALQDPLDRLRRGARVLPSLGELTITNIAYRAGRACLGFKLNTRPVAGNLMVTARPPNVQGTPAPQPGQLADWTWQYRSCDDPEPRIALAMRISNRTEATERFPSNAPFTMELCPLEFSGPTRFLQAERPPIRTFTVEWLDPTGRPAISPPRFILSNTSYTLILSISWSELIAIRDLSLLEGENLFPSAAQFLVAPGFVVLRTSAGRRIVRLPSFNLNRLGNERERLMVSPRLDCGNSRNWRVWGQNFGGRARLGGRIGPNPLTLVDRLIDDSVQAALPQLTLPTRRGEGLLSLERRSVEAVLGRGSPNAWAFAGLPPSNLNDVPAAVAAPIGLARLPRRP